MGHSLVAITLEARAGLRRLSRNPERVGEALYEVEGLAARALEETRSATATIRSDTDARPRLQSPTLDDLPGLVRADGYIRMPGLDGLEATRRLAGPPAFWTPLRSSSLRRSTSTNMSSARFGAQRGFLLKDASPETLVDAIRAVRGQGLIAPEVTRRLIAHFASSAPDPTRRHELERLSEREREVLHEIARGRSNTEIAQNLFIEEATVKSYVSSVQL